MLKKTTLPMSLIDNEITKHVLIWLTVNVAYSPSQNIQGQATSEWTSSALQLASV